MALITLLVVYLSSHETTTVITETPTSSAESLLGCYVFQSGNDIYTLEIRDEIAKENSLQISGVLSYDNFQKDSSSGSFIGTYTDGVLIGNYSFMSEGSHSERQIAFKKQENTFIAGYGPYETVNDIETFTDIHAISYDSKQEFTKSTQCNSLRTFTEQDGLFSFHYNPYFSVFEDKKMLSTNWRLDTTHTGILLARLDVPRSYFPQTNFSGATLTIGQSSDHNEITQCMAPLHDERTTSTEVLIDNFPARKYVWTDVAAGNYYETISYHTIVDGDCFVIEYTLHFTAIANYSPDQKITEFDKEKITNNIEQIIHSITFHINSD